MKGKTLLSLAIVLAMILAAVPFATVKAVSCTVSVVFDENGLNTLTKSIGSDFNVSVKIANSPAIDFFSVKIHWNPALVTLKTNNTDNDVLTGGFLTFFAGPSAAGTHYATGTLDDVSGYRTSGSSSGSGTLFHMVFHCIAAGASDIAIIGMNTDTYLQLSGSQVNIDAIVNGTVTQAPPPATPPQAIIWSPVNHAIYPVGSLVTVDGSHSTDGVDSVPASEACPINWAISFWTVDYHNATPIQTIFNTPTWSFTCGGAGSVDISLTVIAPDPTPHDSSYVNMSSTGPITIYQQTPSLGPSIDVYTARGGQGILGAFPYPYGWSDAYGPQEKVCVYANVTYNKAPVWYKPVEFVVRLPNGTEIASYMAFTNESGIAKVCFRIPWEANQAPTYFGNMSIEGRVDISEVMVNDTVKFPYGWKLNINNVVIANAMNLHRFPHAPYTMSVNVTICSIAITASYPAFLQLTAADEAGVPFGQALVPLGSVPPGSTTYAGITIPIPEWAYVGNGILYADLLNSTAIGLPYCPEVQTPFTIVYP
jgi:hypothetical protein